MPLWGGPRSFWSCYNCSNYDPVQTQIVTPTESGSREKGGIAARDSVTLWRELSCRKKLKRSWPLENENESRKKKVNRVSPSSYVSIHAW